MAVVLESVFVVDATEYHVHVLVVVVEPAAGAAVEAPVAVAVVDILGTEHLSVGEGVQGGYSSWKACAAGGGVAMADASIGAVYDDVYDLTLERAVPCYGDLDSEHGAYKSRRRNLDIYINLRACMPTSRTSTSSIANPRLIIIPSSF